MDVVNLDNIRDFLLGVVGIILIIIAIAMLLGAKKGNITQAGNTVVVVILASVVAGIGLVGLWAAMGSGIASGLFG